MKWILVCAAPVAVAGGVYWHGPLKSGATYARPASEVAYTLETMPLPTAVESTLRILKSGGSRREVVPGKSVTYHFFAKGNQFAKFVAEISPVDATHTRVSTRMTMSSDSAAINKDQIMPVAKEFATVGKIAMNEQISSKLDRRPFNTMLVQQAMASFAVANLGEINAGIANQLSEVSDKMNREPGPVIVPGRPMVDTSAPSRP